MPITNNTGEFLHRLVTYAAGILAVLAALTTRAPADQPVNVLMISSYHPSFPTFFHQIEGVKKGFAEAGYTSEDLVLDIEFMDSKRFPGPAHTERFRQTLAVKLKDRNDYDLILTSDDNALHFALDQRDTLLAGSPIVFFRSQQREIGGKPEQGPERHRRG